jgi:hypothetical protein
VNDHHPALGRGVPQLYAEVLPRARRATRERGWSGFPFWLAEDVPRVRQAIWHGLVNNDGAAAGLPCLRCGVMIGWNTSKDEYREDIL